MAPVLTRAERSDTGVGTSDTPVLSEVDLGAGVKCRKSGVKVSQVEVSEVPF